MTKSNDRISDELISAYLDGEVTAEQRAQVERLLNSDPRSQQTLDELRTLRETLQTLPRHQLDSDFHRRVLQIADQKQRGGPSGSSPPVASDDAVVRDVSSSRGFRRGLFWACIAVAAAILLMVYVPPMSREAIGPVAQQPSTAISSDPTRTSDSTDNVPRSLRRMAPDETPTIRETLVRDTDDQSLGQRAEFYAEGAAVRAEPDLQLKGSAAISGKMGLSTEEFRLDRARNQAEGSASEPEALSPAVEMDIDQPATAAGVPMDLAAGSTVTPFGGIATNGLAADAVIHIRIAPRQGSAEQLLTDNLKRNSIALVRREPAETGETVAASRASQLAREPDSSLYFTNQAAVDYAFVPTEPKQKAVQLLLVQAEAPQIVMAVNELQQEGASVLATVPGPRQTQLGLDRETLRFRQAGRGWFESGITATKGGLEGADRRFEMPDDLYESPEGEPEKLDRPRDAITGQNFADREEHLAVPTRTRPTPLESGQVPKPTDRFEEVEGMGELPEPPTPALQQQWSQAVAGDEARGVQRRAEPDRDYDENFWSAPRRPPSDRPIQFGESTDSFQAPQSTAAFARGGIVQKQIDNLGTTVGGRQLQVLFVLHDDASAFPTAEAVPTANEMPAESAPTEPAGTTDPQLPPPD